MSRSVTRFIVIGSAGCGKSTFARTLARRTGLPHIELDILKHRPDWTTVPDDVFRNQVAIITRDNNWIIDGNYEAVREVVWTRAEMVVWLDYSLAMVMLRLCYRTFRRLLTAEQFSNGNRENVRRVFGPRSALFWTMRIHRRRRRQLELLLSESRYSHLLVVRLRSPAEGAAWLTRPFAPGHSGCIVVEPGSVTR
jgi:adenylate kinase family enzyme